GDVQGHARAQGPVARERVQQQSGLLRAAGAQLHQGGRAGGPGGLVAVAGEDGPLGTGRVVLGQARDLCEQGTAAGVVEPPGRQPLGVGRQPDQRVGAQLRQVVGVVAGDLWVAHGGPPSGSGVISTPVGSATTRWRSGTGRQAGSSSSGSELTRTRSGSWRTDSEWPTVVATTMRESVSRRFRRDPGAAAATCAAVAATADGAGSPSASRWRTSAHSSTESVAASIVSSHVTGSREAGPATESGQPVIRPLWLNSIPPSLNGAHAAAPVGIPAVADRTAASTPAAAVPAASSGRSGSLHMGRSRR